MSMRLALSDSGPALAPISPRRELGAYEALWLEKGATFKTLADRFALDAEALPSDFVAQQLAEQCAAEVMRSEEHTSELQSLMRISYAVFCLKKKKTTINKIKHNTNR